MTPAPVPQRITSALDMADQHGPGVDAALGVREPTVDRWEDGTLTPTRGDVVRLALLTGYPVGWFYRPAVELGGRGVHVCPPPGGRTRRPRTPAPPAPAPNVPAPPGWRDRARATAHPTPTAEERPS